MFKRWMVLIGVMWLVVACGGNSASDPAQLVVTYLQARISGDEASVKRYLCASEEANALREVQSFQSVKAELLNPSCTFDSASNKVSCTGEIKIIYQGENTANLPIPSYNVVQEDGEWKVCGQTE